MGWAKAMTDSYAKKKAVELAQKRISEGHLTLINPEGEIVEDMSSLSEKLKSRVLAEFMPSPQATLITITGKSIVKSHATWTKIGYSDDDHSYHPNNPQLAAESVAKALIREYGRFGRECETRGTCTKAWVTVDGEITFQIS
jgi:hypothetical protein